MMAKNMLPMSSGSGVLGKIVGTVVVLGVLAFVVKHPSDAAHLLTMLLGLLGNAVEGFATFLTQVHG
jgi:hypothetical protein